MPSRDEGEIGDWFRSYAGAKYKTTVPVQELAGGRILSEPRLVSPGIAVPPSFLQVVHTDKIAQESQRHMKNALSHYADQTHRSSIVACRSAIQMALRDLGVQDRAISAMIEDAKERGIVDDFTQLCCKMIADAGGAAAHRAESPDGQREALTVIGLAVTVLGRLYAVPR